MEEILASRLASLADKLERQGPGVTVMLQQASHRYRTSSAQKRTFAMAPDQGTWRS